MTSQTPHKKIPATPVEVKDLKELGMTPQGLKLKKGSMIGPLLLLLLAVLILIGNLKNEKTIFPKANYTNHESLKVFSEPAEHSASDSDLPAQSFVTVVKIVGGWAQVSKDGKVLGYVPAEKLQAPLSVPQTIQKYGRDFKTITWQLLKGNGLFVLFSLLPGVAGLIYRRAFWPWFLASFVVMSVINGWERFGSISGEALTGSEQLYSIVVIQLLLLLLAFRLRRQSSNPGSIPPGIYNGALAIVLMSAAAMLLFTDWLKNIPGLHLLSSALHKLSETHTGSGHDGQNLIVGFEVALVGFPSLYMLFMKRVAWKGKHRKNIVVCLDGTWNDPSSMSDHGHFTYTNVFKLFSALKEDGVGSGGDVAAAALKGENAIFDASSTKRYQDKQIAFYYSGVGSKLDNSKIGEVLGGATGMGATGIMERAYLDLIRVYRPGDKVFIFGFSRGAATARLLANAIDQRKAPEKVWTLRLLGRHWLLRKSEKKESVPIAVLGCWDTVGGFGIPKTIAGINFQKIDMFKNLNVPDNVEQAYHMVAIDETRDSFVPTLMEPDPTAPGRIVEVWFSGGHCNVGGGYATNQLSDIPLDFLLKHVSSGYAYDAALTPGDEAWGLYLTAQKKVPGAAKKEPGQPELVVLDPDPRGQLRQAGGMMFQNLPRELPLYAVVSDTVFQRMELADSGYAPQSLFNHNRKLGEKRELIKTEVGLLAGTQSLTAAEKEKILASSEKLSLMKWSPNGELAVVRKRLAHKAA